MEQSMSNKKKNTYHMTWHTRDGFYIKNNKIYEDINADQVQGVYPLNVVDYAKLGRTANRGAYLDFINIDFTENRNQINNHVLEFTNKYGLLYQDVNDDRRLIAYGHNEKKVMDEKIQKTYNQSVQETIEEGKDLRLIVELYTCLCTDVYKDSEDRELTKEESLLYLLYNFLNTYKANKQWLTAEAIELDLLVEAIELATDEETKEKIDIDYIRKSVMRFIEYRIKRHIENIHFQISCDENIDVPQLKGNLLEAMYFRFYTDILLSFPIKQCRAVECNTIFAVYSDKRQERRKYCCDACRKRHNKQVHSRKKRFS